MKKTNIKSNKGITLVALIITIVVLLILAAVAIGTVKDSNIIGHAENAAISYNQKKTEEEEILSDAEGLVGNLVNSINNGNKTPTTPPPPPPATTVLSYYKADGVIQVVEITGNTVIGNVYSINDDNIAFVRGPMAGVVNNVENPITINLGGGESEDITTEDMQLEASGTTLGYIKGNYLYGANTDGSYVTFELITDTAEIADIEGKIANLNSSGAE